MTGTPVPAGRWAVLRNLSWLAGANIGGSLLAFVALVRIADLLGPAGFGRICFAQAFASYFLLVAEFGVPTVAIRETARRRGSLPSLLRRVLELRLILAGAAFALLAASLPFLPGGGETRWLAALYGAGVLGNALLLEWPFLGLEKMGRVAFSRVLRPGLYAVLVFAVIRGPEDALAVAILNLVALGGACAWLGAWTWRQLRQVGECLDGTASAPAAFDLLRQALPFALSGLLVQVYSSMDVTMLGFLAGEEAVGLYGAGARITSFLIGLGGLFAAVLLPRMAASGAGAARTLERGLEAAVAALLPVAVGGACVGRLLLVEVYGDRYQGGAVPFGLLLFAVPVSATSVLYWNAMAARERGSVPVAAVALGVVANLALNALLIPRIGGAGAAAATLAAELVVWIAVYRSYRGCGGTVGLPRMGRPVIAAGVMGAFLLALRGGSPWVLVPAGAAVYAFALAALGGLPWKART